MNEDLLVVKRSPRGKIITAYPLPLNKEALQKLSLEQLQEIGDRLNLRKTRARKIKIRLIALILAHQEMSAIQNLRQSNLSIETAREKLSHLSTLQLKHIASFLGVTGFEKMLREQLVKIISQPN